MGVFGKTLTLEDAKKKILAESRGISPVAPEAKDLGETGFAFDRESPLTASEIVALEKLKQEDSIGISNVESLRGSIARSIDETFQVTMKDGRIMPKDNDPGARKAMLDEINKRLRIDADIKKKGQTGLNKESINQLKFLKKQYESGVINQTKEKPTLNTAPKDYTSKPKRNVLKSLKAQGFDSFKLNGKTYKIPENI
jgi:hypothetical protein